MTIRYNDDVVVLEEGTTLKQLLDSRNCQSKGTAVAVNNKLVKKENWENKVLFDKDIVVVVNAAYGG